jgi:hypothetical protein
MIGRRSANDRQRRRKRGRGGVAMLQMTVVGEERNITAVVPEKEAKGRGFF